MLVFISDLHFIDGTAGKHNIPPQAFDYFFEDLVSIAHKPSNKIKELKIVLLGDVFDLLRTERWFQYPEDERPWGTDEAAIEAHAGEVLDAVIAANNDALAAIRGELPALMEKCRLEEEARLIYLPGNHDRLVNKYPSLRAKVCEALGPHLAWPGPGDLFHHSHPDLAYGVFARHGQEYDDLNYEKVGSFEEKDYLEVPIGDPITTELLTRLPYELYLILEARGVPKEQRDIIKVHFQQLDNVRPLLAVVPWLLYQVRQEDDYLVRQAIEDAIDQVVDRFNTLQFVKDWYHRHGTWDPLDTAHRVQWVLWLLKLVKLSTLQELLELFGKVDVAGVSLKGKLEQAAFQEFQTIDPRFRYAVYGHDHEPELLPLFTGGAGGSRFYLNTGTWRRVWQQAGHDGSFSTWKNQTYVIFYREGERDAAYPVFETWTGNLTTAEKEPKPGT
jgi:UDP-2,3-diacylglucosamine pyrophosphatase LpxH